jgi:hypothetical protein
LLIRSGWRDGGLDRSRQQNLPAVAIYDCAQDDGRAAVEVEYA